MNFNNFWIKSASMKETYLSTCERTFVLKAIEVDTVSEVYCSDFFNFNSFSNNFNLNNFKKLIANNVHKNLFNISSD